MSGPSIAMLADGRRLHMRHGPIDLIVEAFGADREQALAYRQAVARFETVLDELVGELAELRRPCAATPRCFDGAVAGRMEAACAAHFPLFVTPMAAVAGAVADEVLAALVAGRRLERAYVNNGGDVAFHLVEGRRIDAAIAGTGNGFADRLTIDAASPVRGIATSGWRGRSLSLGIADAVTVVAPNAAAADVAATLIANDVDLPGHRAVQREPARAIDPDSDLGDRPVTRHVGALDPDDIDAALARGLATARAMKARGLIAGAALFLAGDSRIHGEMPTPGSQAVTRQTTDA